MNPLMGMMGNAGGNNPMSAISQAMQVVNQIKQFGNPHAAMDILAQQNPNIKRQWICAREKIHNRYLSRCADRTEWILGKLQK